MRKAWILLILGIWIAILPFLGFPYSWKDTLTALSGLCLICLSFLIYKDYKMNENQDKIFDNFRENKNFAENKKAGMDESVQ